MIKKLAKPGLILIGLIAFYALTGFVVLPKLLAWKLPEIIHQTFGAPASLSSITFNPFNGQLKVSGFDLKDKNKQPLFAFAELFADLDAPESLKSGSLALEQLQLNQPVLHIIALKEGGYNFPTLQSADKPDEKPKNSLFPLEIKQLALNNGELSWLDLNLSESATETFKAINLSLKDFTTEPNGKADLTLAGQLSTGGELSWQTDLSVQPFGAKGHIKLDKLPVNRLWTLFLKDQLNFKLADGEANVGFDYQLAYLNEKVQLTVKEGTLAARCLQFTAVDNPQPVIDIPEFSIQGIDFDWDAQKLQIADIATKGVNLKTWLNNQGQFNYKTLFTGKADSKKAATSAEPVANPIPVKPWRVTIARTGFQNLNAEFEDRTENPLGKAKVAEVNIQLNGLLLDYTPEQLQLSIQKGSIGGQNLSLLKPVDQMVTQPLSLKLGELQFTLGEYKLDYHASKLDMLARDGSLVLFNFKFNDPNSKQPLIAIPDLTVQGARFDLAKQQLSINRVQSEKGSLNAWLDKEGRLNYQQLFKTGQSKYAKSVKSVEPIKPASDKQNWQLSLNEFQLKNYRLKFQDNTQKEPVSFELAPFNLTLQNVTQKKGAKFLFTLLTKVNQTGALDLKGHLIMEPFSSEIQVALKNLGLKNFQEYLNDYLRVDIIDGALDSTATLKLSRPTPSLDLQLQVHGGTDVKEFVLRDQIINKDLIKWQSLKLDAVDFDLADLRLNIGNVLIRQPYGRVTIKQDRSLNFDDIIIKHTPGSTSVKAAPAKLEPGKKAVQPGYQIGAVTIAGGSSDFSDFSLILPFVVQLNDLNGRIKSISSDQKKLTDFDLAGKVFDLSPMDVKGKFNADFSELDIGMHFKGMPLPFISPYMVEFAGYKIEKGKMSVDLLYKITDRKLTAENNFVLDQLTLGEKVENPKATSLPLSLAIALLKDGDGRIKINMPISGSLDDPQFSVIPLLWDAFVNMLTRVVSSPFSALGALVSSDADFSAVIFSEGAEELPNAEYSKLNDLAIALQKKPELSIEIKGRAYEKQDWPAMQEDALLDQLKAVKAEELKKLGKRQRAEYVELSEGDYQRLLADLFIQKFPHLGKRPLFGTPELIDSNADFYEVAKKQLAAVIPPNKLKLTELASARARNIAQYLIQKGGISQERIFILDFELKPQTPNNEITCELALRVQ